MPARDIFHYQVRHALEKEGWIITHDPLFIRSGGVPFHIDLGAEKLIAAEKNGEKIAVEIKSFSGVSVISDFHEALGQFRNYRLALRDMAPERVLFLAAPFYIFDDFFQLPFGQAAIHENQLKLLVYDPYQEVIVRWLP